MKIDYRLIKGERSEEGIINKDQRHERRYRFVVANHHSQPIEITLLDHLPVPRDERIEVELLRGITQPSERNHEGKPGLLAWTGTYAPGEEKTIEFGFQITFPQDETIPGF